MVLLCFDVHANVLSLGNSTYFNCAYSWLPNRLLSLWSGPEELCSERAGFGRGLSITYKQIQAHLTVT